LEDFSFISDDPPLYHPHPHYQDSGVMGLANFVPYCPAKFVISCGVIRWIFEVCGSYHRRRNFL